MTKFGRIIHRLSEVDSTNNYASNLLQRNLAENGTAIVADFQTAGKGQRGNNWFAQRGLNLTCTFIYFPDNLSLKEQFLLNCWVALSVSDVLTSFNIPNSIKWPNDIYVGHKKIAGILIETASMSDSITSVILGVGINVNQGVHEEERAVSMIHIKNESTDTNELFFALCSALQLRETQLSHSQELFEEFEKRLLFINKRFQFEREHRVLEGILLGITPAGLLRIQVEENEIQVTNGEIKFLIP